MRKLLSISILLLLLVNVSSCRIFHGKYHGLAKADRQKMKAVARHNKAVAKGSSCPAVKEMKKKEEEDKKAQQSLMKQSQRQAGK